MKEKKGAAVIRNPATSYERFENWATRNDKRIFYFIIALSLFLSLISFNARISEAHDDALYLEGGWRYVNEFPSYFYTQNAPLYVMFLAVLIKIFGFKLMLFKVFSMIFHVSGVVLFYKALRNVLPAVVFLPAVLFQATNHLALYYASMTFTESFYFFLQGFFFLQVVYLLSRNSVNDLRNRGTLKAWLLFGLSMFLMSTAKSAAIVVLPAMILFFALEKNWKGAAITVVAYLVYKLPYEILVRLIWGTQNQFAGQSKILLQKDPYDKAMGEEDISGFITRLIENTNLSLSKRFYQLIGWRAEDSSDTSWLFTFITLGIALFGFWKLYKAANRPLTAISLFTGAQLVLSYLILQVRWDQPRITLVLMPALLIMMFYGIYAATRKPGFGQTIYFVLAVFVTGSVIISSFRRGLDNVPIVKKNLKGDKYYGYTPDWQNFLKCSEWCGDSLGAESLVLSRKAPMSFVYGNGKKFFPCYSVVYKDTATNQSEPDSALAFFRRNNVTHVMMAHLRMNPDDPGHGFINTIHNIFYPIARKYPHKLTLIHAEGLNGLIIPPEVLEDPAQLIGGGGQYEECYVYRINY